MNRDSDVLIHALRSMPEPELRHGFVDQVLANEAKAARNAETMSRPGRLRHVLTRWEAWVGTLGAAVATALTLLLLQSLTPDLSDQRGITLALNEVRDIGVLVESTRDLEGATIRIAVTGGAVLAGFGSRREIGWRANLKHGSNLLSLPLVARRAGSGKLVAVIEHQGRTRRMSVNLTVKQAGIS